MSDPNLGLKEPDKMDWDNYQAGSKFVPPPPALDANGKPIVYFAQVPASITPEATDDGLRAYLIDPLKIVRSGNGADGYELRFTRVNVRKFKNRKTGEPINASSCGNFLKAAGIQAKPQTNAEYDRAVQAARGKVVATTIDWEAYNKDNGERVRGFNNFPDDPDRPGQKKAILKQGDTYTDYETNETRTVKSEVLFANARQRFFEVPRGK